MSNTVFSLEWLAASSQGFSDTPETLPSGTDSDINKVDAFSCSSLFFAPETQSGSGGYSSTTIVPQLNDPYYSAASLQHSLPDFSSIASTDGILPPNTTADGILPPNTTGKFQGCKVCGDAVSGNHFGVLSCDACKNFFRRSTRMKRPYACRGNRSCTVSVHTRSRCQYCRLKKCLAVGMKIQAIQDEDIFASSDHPLSSFSTPIESPYYPSKPPFHIPLQGCLLNLNFGSRCSNSSIALPYSFHSELSLSLPLSLWPSSSEPLSSSGPLSSGPSYSGPSSSGPLSSGPLFSGLLSSGPSPSGPSSSGLSSSGLSSLEPSPSGSPFPAQETCLWSPSILLDESNVWMESKDAHLVEKCTTAQDLVRGLEACLLRMIQWSMNIPEFRNLNAEDQVSLLRNSWCEQCTLQFAVWNASDSSTAGRGRVTVDQTQDATLHGIMCDIVEVSSWLEHLGIDRMELAFMRGILLFNPVSAGLTLASREKVVVCQDHFISLMTSHASKTHGTLSQQRTAKLLFQLSPLKCISQNVIAVLKEYRAHGTAMMGDIFDELVDF